MRLIDADELMKTLGITDMDCEKCKWGSHGRCTRGGDFEDACSAIEDAPTVEPKHGHWVLVGFVGQGTRLSKCSICGRRTTYNGNFCAQCGAKMDEVTDV